MTEKNSSYTNKLIVLAGPTASGKSELAVLLAKRFCGEIINADSRQIFRGLNLGTGKVPGEWLDGVFVYKEVPHYLIDFVNIETRFSVSDFQQLSREKVMQIHGQSKIPIVCGGTGYYIDSLVYDVTLPGNEFSELPTELKVLGDEELFEKLKEVDPERASNVDRFNRRRVERALLINIITGANVPKFQKSLRVWDTLYLAVKRTPEELRNRIRTRLEERFGEGMIDEVKDLLGSNLTYERALELGLEYRYIAMHLKGEMGFEEMKTVLEQKIWQYSRRQMTWLRKNKDVVWVEGFEDAQERVVGFLGYSVDPLSSSAIRSWRGMF